MPNRISVFPALHCLVFVAVISAAAFADGSRDRTQFGRDITVGTGEEASDVTCFGCSVHILGHVAGDVTTFGGNIVVENQGEIVGDTTSFGGSVRLDKGAKVKDLTLFGGRLRRDPDALVAGDVTNFSGNVWLATIFGLPLVFLGGIIALIVWIVRRMTRSHVPAAA